LAFRDALGAARAALGLLPDGSPAINLWAPDGQLLFAAPLESGPLTPPSSTDEP
jgi:hypothetical protein